MNVSWIYCHNHFIIQRNQTIAFNLYSDECQLFLTKNGKIIVKMCKPLLWELTLPVLSVSTRQWWQGSLGRPTSWKTWSLSWGNIEEWSPLSRKHLLSRGVGLRIETDGGREGVMFQLEEQPGQRLSADPSGLLLKRSPELWDLLVHVCGS